MPATMVPRMPRRQKYHAPAGRRRNSRGSCQVLISWPWVSTISGTTTAVSAASGA
jgi:hypothetical protein